MENKNIMKTMAQRVFLLHLLFYRRHDLQKSYQIPFSSFLLICLWPYGNSTLPQLGSTSGSDSKD